MKRISKQQDNQAHREPRLLPPTVKNDSRHRSPAPEIVPFAFQGLSFLCHLKKGGSLSKSEITSEF